MSQKDSKVLQQSGVIPYRVREGKIEVLLITTRNRQEWVVPKGGICNGMSPPESAAKEAWEEAGVIGQVETYEIGCYKYRKQGNIYQVRMFLLPVQTILEEYPEVNQRKRQWLDISQAIRYVKIKPLKRMFKTLKNQDKNSEFRTHNPE